MFPTNTDDEDSYRAIPTIIDDDSGIVQSEQSPGCDDNNNNKHQDHIETITSDSDLSLVNCYDVENAKIYQQTSDGDEKELRITVNTEGLFYKPFNSDEIDDIEINVNDESPTNISIEFDTTGPVHIPDEFEEIKTEPERFSSNIEIHMNTDPGSEHQPQNTPEIQPRQLKATPRAQKRNKKPDNTLIKKIYSDPVVRNFALTNREQIPRDHHEKSQPEITVSTPKLQKTANINVELSPINIEQFAKLETPRIESTINLDDFSLELSDSEVLQRQNSSNHDPEITQLKQQRLVANRLGEFSKSFPNLTKLPTIRNEIIREDENRNDDWKLNELQHQSFVSVKDLKKKFESNEAINNKSKPVHSLTARSISKPIREKLKNEDNINKNSDRIVISPEFRDVEEEVMNTNLSPSQ